MWMKLLNSLLSTFSRPMTITPPVLPAADLIVQLYYIILSAVYNFEIIKYLLCILFSMINTCLNNFSGLEPCWVSNKYSCGNESHCHC